MITRARTEPIRVPRTDQLPVLTPIYVTWWGPALLALAVNTGILLLALVLAPIVAVLS